MAKVIVRRPVEAEVGVLLMQDCATSSTSCVLKVPKSYVKDDGGDLLVLEFGDAWELGDLVTQYLRARGRKPGEKPKPRKSREKPKPEGAAATAAAPAATTAAPAAPADGNGADEARA